MTTKRWLIAIPSILAVLIALLLVAPGFIDWNQYKAQAVQQIKTITGYDVDLAGDLGLAILPAPRVYAGNVSIRAAEGSAAPDLLTLERVDMNLDFGALIQGKIDFSSIDLVKPVATLEVFSDGRENWMTPELKAMSAPQGEGAPKAASRDIAVRDLSIHDGRFSYKDGKTGKTTELGGVNVDLSAGSLKGPFEAEGTLDLGGTKIAFDATGGKLSDDAASLPVNVQAQINGRDAELEFAGVTALSAPYEIQGETRISVPHLDKFAPGIQAKSLSVKGLLTASSEHAALKNAGLDLDGTNLTGDVAATLSPLKITGNFAAKGPVNLDKLLPSSSLSSSGGADSGGLPQTMTLPVPFEAKLAFDLPAVTYNGKVLKDVRLGLVKGAKNFAAEFAAKEIPGKANIDGSVSLDFAAKSVSKASGAETYSEPSLGLKLSGKTQNLQETVQTLPGIGVMPFLGAWKTGGFDIDVDIAGNRLKINKFATQDFADLAFKASGEIADFRAMNGIDMTLSGHADDARAAAKTFGLDESSLPQNLSAIDVSAKLSGNLDAMSVVANTKALNGELIASARVEKPLSDLRIDDLTLQVKHRNMNEMLRMLSPSAPQYASWQKPLDFYAKIAQNGKVYKLSGIKADLAGASLTGDITADTGGAKPDISGALNFGDLVMISSRSGGSPGGGASSGGPSSSSSGAAKSGGKWSNAPLDMAWMNAFNADLNIKARSITYETWDLKNPELDFAVKDGTLDIRKLNSALFGGALAMNGSVASPPGGKGPVQVSGKTSMDKVQVESLVKALVGTNIIKGQGEINLNTDLKTQGASMAALISGLSGNGTAKGEKIVLEGFDLSRFARALSDKTKPGDTALGLWKTAMKGGSTAFDTLDGNFNIAQGVVNIQKLDLDGPEALLATTGNINLPAWTIQTAHNISLKGEEKYPPFTVNISGPLDNPANTFAQGVLQDYISRKINRKLDSILGDVLNGKLQAPSAPQAPAPEDIIPSDGIPSDAQQQQQAPQQNPQDINPEDALKGLLKDILR